MFGLLGKKLSHSFSKTIHEFFTNESYQLIEKDKLNLFFTQKNFKGINVTIPYKNDVIPYLDELSPIAETLQSVNCIINRNNKLIGYNTDYYGLGKTLELNAISVKGKHVIILGNGSTSRTIYTYCKENLAKKITILARNPRTNEYDFTYVENCKTASIVFNATPVGMFPYNFSDVLLDLNMLPNLISIVDVIYNPLRSNLLIEAEKRGIQAVNGLMMLIYQAIKSIELFHNIKVSDKKVLEYYKNLSFEKSNLVFIGMPMSGKSFFGKQTAKIYNKEFIDLDQALESKNNLSIDYIFKNYGEERFRMLEHDIVRDFSKVNNKAISCGGGVILNSENMDYLKQNGIVIFIDFPLEKLKDCNPKGRPLLKNKNNLEKLFKERYNIYKRYADIVIDKQDFDETKTLSQIEVKLNEYINLKWS